MLDINYCYEKLVKNEKFSEDEISDLLNEIAQLRRSVAFLASCQAATLENLPRSYSKSARRRHVSLCDAAAKLLSGDFSPIRFAVDPEHARQRCISAVEHLNYSTLGN